MHVIVNRRAGTVLESGEETFNSAVVDEFAKHGCDAAVDMVEPTELPAAFTLSLRSKKVDLTVVAGGDGSINAILPDLLRSDAAIAVLPLGTLNLIAGDLGATGDLVTDIANIAHGETVAADIVTINGEPFHSSAGLGWFVTMATERQAARERFPFSRKLGFAWAGLRSLSFSRPIEVECRTVEGTAVYLTDAVLITNNRFSGGQWRRERLDDGLMEIHIVKAGSIWLRLSMLVSLYRGTWRESPHVTTFQAEEASLRRTSRRKTIRVAIDGELRKLTSPLSFRVMRGAIHLISARSDA